MLPSEYVDETLKASSVEWREGADRILREHGIGLNPRVLQLIQEALVREVLLFPGFLKEVLATALPGNESLGSMLVTMSGPWRIAAGLLLLRDTPHIRTLNITGEAKNYFLSSSIISSGARITEAVLGGSRLHAKDGEFQVQLPLRVLLELPVPIALAKMPALELTTRMGESVDGENSTVTVGLPVRDRRRAAVVGFTTVEHALGTDKTATYTLHGGRRCEVVRRSDVWDSAFVACDQVRSSLPVRSIMRDHAPGRGMKVMFVGSASGEKSATIDSVDPILPHYSPTKATEIARVYTNRCTKLGDSGAVLVNGDGVAIGQTVMRTKEEEPLQYSVWMWMAGVIDSLEVEPIFQ